MFWTVKDVPGQHLGERDPHLTVSSPIYSDMACDKGGVPANLPAIITLSVHS